MKIYALFVKLRKSIKIMITRSYREEKTALEIIDYQQVMMAL
jgi:hypothetical protein